LTTGNFSQNQSSSLSQHN
jgi:hypothetical protein